MFYIFNELSDSTKRRLSKEINVITKTYPKDTIIFNEGDYCKSICFVKKGRIIVKNIFTDGHEIIVKQLEHNDSFGEGLVFSNCSNYKGTFIAVENVELKMITKEDLIHLIDLNTQVALNIFNHLNEQSCMHMEHIKLLSLKKVSSKVASFFYLKYKELGKEFNISFNKTEIAQYLNIERPTFSKELNYLIKSNIIGYNHKRYEIKNPDLLIERI